MALSLFMSGNTRKLRELLSHVYEFPIEQAESKYSTILNVSLYQGRYMLSTRNAVYSFEDKYESFAEIFRKLHIAKRDIRKALLLGFGLGSIPQILESQHQLHCHYVAVEIDPVVIQLARRYAYKPASSKIDIFCTDACEYVKYEQDRYDLICVDLFIDDSVPENAESELFLYHLKRLLNEGGLLLYSRLNNDKFQQSANNVFKREHFKKVFSPVREITTRGNLMLIYEAG